VTDASLDVADYRDAYRGLVNEADQMDNIGQIRALGSAARGIPLSFEAFSPDIHNLSDPKPSLIASRHFIEHQMEAMAA
jgi:2-keto-myo-inositol isomerase